MEEDVKKYCQQCSQCQATKGSKSKQYEFRTTHGSYPFQRVAIDFWGPLPTAQGVKAYKYILVVLDTYTKFVELFPVVSNSSEEVAEVFYNKFILKHGVPEEVLQDNGPPFSSLYHSQLTTLIGSENMFTPAYHPQSNVQPTSDNIIQGSF
ncbi:hypothetical protein G6F17_013377 [Rhizopus arrhizus]|nr:hypothetical protein G6F23_012917 [Rhizopus arrhizus]KAG0846518.1 hypothetical protein G6F17_013377 [Rhizopus arrhizus]KAG1274116.1 hypothetical protein G6F66_013031 [Rhizopus arrhizus]KAG1389891.1 hypothetical protein G6F60_013174 [Rhizopus arrhizus]